MKLRRQKKAENKKLAYLGKDYWKNLRMRHLEIRTDCAVSFDSKGEDWCKYRNFEAVFTSFHAKVVCSRIGAERDEESGGDNIDGTGNHNIR
jgi:hypothetical protein